MKDQYWTAEESVKEEWRLMGITILECNVQRE